MSRCEDYPACGHTDGLPCDWVYVPGPHDACDHETGYCLLEEEPDEHDDYQVSDTEYMYLYHTQHPSSYDYWLPEPNPFRPIHSDITMCRVLMAWGHGVTDTDQLLAAQHYGGPDAR